MSALHDDVPSTAAATGVRGVRPGTYRVAPTRSAVSWRVRKLGLFTVTGTFAVREGSVQVGSGSALAHVVIDAGSFTTASRRRDADVRGPNFLDAAGHPSLTWDGELTDGVATAPGTLRVRDGVSDVAVEVDRVDITPSAVTVTARARVDRFAAGVTAARGIAGQFLDLELTLTLLPR